MGRWHPVQKMLRAPAPPSVGTWHMRTVTLLHQVSHLQQVINSGHTSPCLHPPFKLNHGLGQQGSSLLRLPTSCICKALFSRADDFIVLWSFKSKSGSFLLMRLGWTSQGRAETVAHCTVTSFGLVTLTRSWTKYGKLHYKLARKSRVCVSLGEIRQLDYAIVWSSKVLLFQKSKDTSLLGDQQTVKLKTLYQLFWVSNMVLFWPYSGQHDFLC